MAKPKESLGTPLKTGIRFVRKAGMWCYFETFNHENVPDKILWFDTEAQAKEARAHARKARTGASI